MSACSLKELPTSQCSQSYPAGCNTVFDLQIVYIIYQYVGSKSVSNDDMQDTFSNTFDNVIFDMFSVFKYKFANCKARKYAKMYIVTSKIPSSLETLLVNIALNSKICVNGENCSETKGKFYNQ